MINSITVYNRFYMDLVACNIQKVPYEYWHLISISCPDTPENTRSFINDQIRMSLSKLGCNKILALQFDDLKPDLLETCLKFNFKPTLFSEEQAKKIIDFINDLHNEEKDSDLVVHCDAGISRSGAIAKFVSGFLNIPFYDPYIRPNEYILSVLWEEADKISTLVRPEPLHF